MAKEIEKKFLVNESLKKVVSEMIQGSLPPKLITQGYIMLGENQQLRIRLVDSEAFLCLKYTEDLVRDEYEYKIPLTDGLEILGRCEFVVQKIRQVLIPDGNDVRFYEFDTYPNGLVVVEVEFDSAEEANNFERPRFLGEEITNNREYSNITLAKQNLRFIK